MKQKNQKEEKTYTLDDFELPEGLVEIDSLPELKKEAEDMLWLVWQKLDNDLARVVEVINQVRRAKDASVIHEAKANFEHYITE